MVKLKEIRKRDYGIATHWVDAWLLHILNRTATFFITDSDYMMSVGEQRAFDQGIAKMQVGTPLAYLIGKQPFWSLEFLVNEHTLIPRPDTEVLIEQVLDWIETQYKNGTFDNIYNNTDANVNANGDSDSHSSASDTPYQLLDLGTGSGCIAISLAHELAERYPKQWQVTALDYSKPALAMTQKNIDLNKVSNIEALHSDWFSSLASCEPTLKYHVIVANPPYIDNKDSHLDKLSAEPLSALIADNHGLADIEKIIEEAPDFLKANALMAIEHGYDQGESVRQLFKQNGFVSLQTIQDYGGNDRVTLAQKGQQVQQQRKSKELKKSKEQSPQRSQTMSSNYQDQYNNTNTNTNTNTTTNNNTNTTTNTTTNNNINNNINTTTNNNNTLSDEELLRYSRQILLDSWDIDAQLNIKSSQVIIIGAGGLGCPVSEVLARAGVGRIHLIDDDVIEVSNLQRQTLFTMQDIGQPKAQVAERKLQEINHLIQVGSSVVRLSADNINHYLSALLTTTNTYRAVDTVNSSTNSSTNSSISSSQTCLILDCTDNFIIRDLLNKFSVEYRIPLLSASAIAMSGQLALFEPARLSGCYHCIFGSPHKNNATEEASDVLSADNASNANCVTSGVLASTTAIMGSLQANAALQYLGCNNNPLLSKLLLWDGIRMEQRHIRYRRDSNCPICGDSIQLL